MRLTTGFTLIALLLTLCLLAACGQSSSDNGAAPVETPTDAPIEALPARDPLTTALERLSEIEKQNVQAALDAYDNRKVEIFTADTPLIEEWQKQFRDRYLAAQAIGGGALTVSLSQEISIRAIGMDMARHHANESRLERDAFLEPKGIELTQAEMLALVRSQGAMATSVTEDRVNWLTDVYDERGEWFSISEIGEQGAQDAYIIIRHSTDSFLLARVRSDMEGLFLEGEADGATLAYLSDRLKLEARKPQLYGTQMVCVDGRIQPHEIEDAFDLDARRKNLGLEPMADYAARFADVSC